MYLSDLTHWEKAIQTVHGGGGWEGGGEGGKVNSHFGVQSYEILKPKVTLEIDGRHFHLGLRIVSSSQSEQSQVEEVDVDLELGEGVTSINQQGGPGLFVGQDL